MGSVSPKVARKGNLRGSCERLYLAKDEGFPIQNPRKLTRTRRQFHYFLRLQCEIRESVLKSNVLSDGRPSKKLITTENDELICLIRVTEENVNLLVGRLEARVGRKKSPGREKLRFKNTDIQPSD